MSLVDLPTETLELITTQLDNTSLYSIAQVNPRLTHIALSFFFQRVKLHEAGTLEDGVLTLTPKLLPALDVGVSRHTILGAIRLSPFFDDIHTYKVEVGPDMQNAFIDLQEFRGILKKTRECTALELSFDALDAAMAHPKRFDNTGEAWAEAILGVVEEALKKGCKHLRIVNGGSFLTAISKHCLDSKEGVSASFLKALTPISPSAKALPPVIEAEDQPLPPWPSSLSDTSRDQFRLNSCIFQQGILLERPFRDWTISALSNSPNLTSLTFTRQSHLSLRSFPPRLLMSTLTFPFLTEFRLQDVAIWSWKDLCAFLRRHSGTLRIFDLSPSADCAFVEIFSPEIQSEEEGGDISMPTDEEFNTPMPMLEEISLSPDLLFWLWNQPLSQLPSLSSVFRTFGLETSSSPSRERLSLYSRFPRLREVTIYADHMNGIMGYTFSELERAFQVLAFYIESFKESSCPDQSPLKTLVLSSLIPQTAFKPFFKKHQVLDVPDQPSVGILGRIFGGTNSPSGDTSGSTSIASPLKGIHTFRVVTQSVPDFRTELGVFVKGFPDLETYEIVHGHPWSNSYRSTLNTAGQGDV